MSTSPPTIGVKGPSAAPVAAALTVAGGVFALTPWCKTWLSLLLGIVLAVAGLSAFTGLAKKHSRTLMQVAIVLLGLSIDLAQVARAGVPGLAFAAGTIVLVFAVGAAVARWLALERNVAALVASGTAICGGSAIAATSTVIRATAAQTSVALGVVFVLNAVALFVFPPLGQWLQLSQQQFGAWAAVAIHDMASVTGAGKAFGPEALEQATVIKLTRVLWIVPVAVVLGWYVSRGDAGRTSAGDGATVRSARWTFWQVVPWFIAAFVGAVLLRAGVLAMLGPGDPAAMFERFAAGAKSVAGAMMALALFLIGSTLSRKAIAEVGWRPMVHGVILWLTLSVVSLLVIRATID